MVWAVGARGLRTGTEAASVGGWVGGCTMGQELTVVLRPDSPEGSFQWPPCGLGSSGRCPEVAAWTHVFGLGPCPWGRQLLVP